jgi:hypothetical protein
MGTPPVEAHDAAMTSLHINVRITDLEGFKAGYARHADARTQRGVRRDSVRHPLGDDQRLVIDLDFDSAAEAEAFLGFLRTEVWPNQPVLAATPEATILESVAVG